MKKVALFSLVLLFLFAVADLGLAKDCPTGQDDECQKVAPGEIRTLKCINKKCVRALELSYPIIGGELQEIVIAEGLPGYVDYIFKLAVGIIGLIIFGMLVYNGIRFVVSTGSPTMLKEARAGILYALLGGALLISSVIIFNTINPQIKILELAEMKPLEQVLQEGVYICDYKVDDLALSEAVTGYLYGTEETQIEAAKKLRKIMYDPDTGKTCFRVNFSGPFQNFTISPGGQNNTIFILPHISENPNTQERILKWNYGIVLHEKDNFGGQCAYYPEHDAQRKIYQEVVTTGGGEHFGIINLADLPFQARAVTLFQKPLVEPQGEAVTLYECFEYNQKGKCNGDPPQSQSFSLGAADVLKKGFAEKGARSQDLEFLQDPAASGEEKKWEGGFRSIRFSPQGSYLVLLYEEGKTFEGDCRVVHQNTPNVLTYLTYKQIDGTGCDTIGALPWFLVNYGRKFFNCQARPGSMIIIKGTRL